MLKIKIIVLAIILTLTVGCSFGFNKEQNNNHKGNSSVDTIEKTVTNNLQEEKENKTEDTVQVEQSNQVEKKVAETNEIKEKFKNIKVRAVYLTGPSAGIEKVLDNVIELSKKTELNAVVIDVKEAGKVNYKSNIPAVKENNLYINYYNPDKIIEKLHENNIYAIGRIVCFRDSGLASKRADLAIKRPDGTIWREGKRGDAWINPYLDEALDYNIDIAKEAVSKGFDEIQFDYVRFPTAKASEVYYGSNVGQKTDAICAFLSKAGKELHTEGTTVSADVFGIICESRRDGTAIGQDLEKIGKNIDYICPMVYPSHYANASHGVMGNGVGQDINGILFKTPDLKPYEVVYNTLVKAHKRISNVSDYKAKVRPYLQDFTATYLPKGYFQDYGAQQVKEQIKAVYDAGYDEWILWDAKNTYSSGVFETKK